LKSHSDCAIHGILETDTDKAGKIEHQTRISVLCSLVYEVKDIIDDDIVTKKIFIRHYLVKIDSLSGEAFNAGLQA
jgi:hypothetical protein